MSSALDRLNSQPSGSGAVNAAGFTNGLPSADNQALRSDGVGGAIQGSDIVIADASGSSVAVSTSAGNALTISATAPAATTGASQVGKAVGITASNAVASTDTAGAATGGAVTLTAGNAARNTSGNAKGANVIIVPGTGIGTGAAGVLSLNGATSSQPALTQRPSNAQFEFVNGDNTSRTRVWVDEAYFNSTLGNYSSNSVWVSGTPGNGVGVSSGGVIGWVAGADATQSKDTGISRGGGAGLINFGNGTASDFTGTIKFASDIVGATNGGLWTRGFVSELLTLSTGGTTTDTTANLAPANAIIESITYRITTTIATATAFTIKVKAGNSMANIGTATTSQTTLTVNTTGVLVPAAYADQYNASATKVTVDTTGTPSAGIIRITLWYRQLTPSTS